MTNEISRLNREISIIDSEKIKETIEEIIRISVIARHEGLLALEDYANKTTNSTVKSAIMLVVDGTDPELVRRMLEMKHFANGRGGAEGLSELMILEGILLVQDGCHPNVIEEFLRQMVKDEIIDCIGYVGEAICKEEQERMRKDDEARKQMFRIAADETIYVKKKKKNKKKAGSDSERIDGMLTQKEIEQLLRGE